MAEYILPLAAPLKTTTGELREIRFREPNGLDLIEIGEPMIVKRTAAGDRARPETMTVTIQFERDMAKVASYLQRCSGLGLASFAGLGARDLRKAADWLCDDVFGGGGDEAASPLGEPSSSSSGTASPSAT